jgi:integrase/recombinase XerD
VLISTDDFIQFLTIKKPVSASSVRLVTCRINLFLDFINEHNLALTAATVESYLFHLKKLGRKNNSINTYIFSIRYFYDYLKDRKIETENFLEGLESLPKEKPVIDVLSTEEIERILEVDIEKGTFRGLDSSRLNDVYKTLIRFLACTGCRFDEAASLTVKHVDIARGSVRFIETKNKEYRSAYMREPLLGKIREMVSGRKPTDLVFQNMLGKKIYPTDFGPDLRKRAKLAGITKRIHPHLFRHSYATELLSQGVGIDQVAKLIGHKDIQTTYNNYAHLADEILRRANDFHPLVRQNIDPKEYLYIVTEMLKSYRLDRDKRFVTEFVESSAGIRLEVTINRDTNT